MCLDKEKKLSWLTHPLWLHLRHGPYAITFIGLNHFFKLWLSNSIFWYFSLIKSPIFITQFSPPIVSGCGRPNSVITSCRVEPHQCLIPIDYFKCSPPYCFPFIRRFYILFFQSGQSPPKNKGSLNWSPQNGCHLSPGPFANIAVFFLVDDRQLFVSDPLPGIVVTFGSVNKPSISGK